jgi:hypothetical protein
VVGPQGIGHANQMGQRCLQVMGYGVGKGIQFIIVGLKLPGRLLEPGFGFVFPADISENQHHTLNLVVSLRIGAA